MQTLTCPTDRKIQRRLGDVLVRLNHSVTQHQQAAAVATEKYQRWQAQWRIQSESLAVRLGIVDAELQKFSGQTTRPELTILRDSLPGE